MLMRWDPFREFERLTEELRGDSFRRMPMDAYRHGDEFIVCLDLPGVDPDSIDVTIESDTLTVKAERRAPWGADDERIVCERAHGTFTRQLLLGENLDREKLTARYDQGVLTLTIPVAEQAKPRHVSVVRGEDKKELAASAA